MAIKHFTPEDRKKIRATFYPKAGNDSDFEKCIAIAEEYNLSPFLGEIHFIERSEKNDDGQWDKKVLPMVGKDGYLTIAHRTGQFGAIRCWVAIEQVPVLQLDGTFALMDDLVATATGWRKDYDKIPTVVKVAFNEYAGKTRSGALTKMWREKYKTMIGKVAESQLIRKQYNIVGFYSPEEMGVGEIDDNGKLVLDRESVNITGPSTSSSPGKSTSTPASAPAAKSISLAQVKTIEKLMVDTKTEEVSFLKYIGIETLDRLPESRFDEVVAIFERKLKKASATPPPAEENHSSDAADGTTATPSEPSTPPSPNPDTAKGLSLAQVKTIEKLMVDTKTEEVSFLKYIKIETWPSFR